MDDDNDGNRYGNPEGSHDWTTASRDHPAYLPFPPALGQRNADGPGIQSLDPIRSLSNGA